jgi:hypothetical protein
MTTYYCQQCMGKTCTRDGGDDIVPYGCIERTGLYSRWSPLLCEEVPRSKLHLRVTQHNDRFTGVVV